MLKTYGSPAQAMPLKIVGGTKYGRYSKISTECTYNMFISDGWLVPFSGYKKVATNISEGRGRELYASEKLGKMVLVCGTEVFLVDRGLYKTKIGDLATNSTDISIAENNAEQIAIEDKKNIYVYSYRTGEFTTVVTDFTPGYIAFQDGYFIAADSKSEEWRLSELNNGLSFPWSANTVGELQTKPTNVKACIPIPGRGHQLLVIGKNVTQHWTNVGNSLFPYQQTTAFNIDYGCANQATIGVGDTFVVWLGYNEKSGFAILMSDGGPCVQISNEGINARLAQLHTPDKAYGMMYKQDGHVFYLLTFYGDDDNFTLLYDFNTREFFSLCDKNMDHHIARSIVHFNNTFYFLSHDDNNLYEFNAKYTTEDESEMQRIRIAPPVRFDNQSQFVVNNIGFTIEQGITDDPMRIDVSISRNGGETFGNTVGTYLRKSGKRKNKFILWNLGMANDFVVQLRFHGKERFVCTDGVVSVYQ